VQEIFGVNEHIRSLVEQYAAAGYLTIAPALFDRIGRNIELNYTPSRPHLARLYAADRAQRCAKGYCCSRSRWCAMRAAWHHRLLLGGQLAWYAASRLGVDAAVSYYGLSCGRRWSSYRPRL